MKVVDNVVVGEDTTVFVAISSEVIVVIINVKATRCAWVVDIGAGRRI